MTSTLGRWRTSPSDELQALLIGITRDTRFVLAEETPPGWLAVAKLEARGDRALADLDPEELREHLRDEVTAGYESSPGSTRWRNGDSTGGPPTRRLTPQSCRHSVATPILGLVVLAPSSRKPRYSGAFRRWAVLGSNQ